MVIFQLALCGYTLQNTLYPLVSVNLFVCHSLFPTADEAEEEEDGEPPVKYNKLIMPGKVGLG